MVHVALNLFAPWTPFVTGPTRQNVIPSVPRLSADSKDASQTRSTGAVHTSAKARLTTVAIRIQIPHPDRHQNLTFFRWLIANLPWKFYANPLTSFCAKLPTDKETNNDDCISSLAEVIIGLWDVVRWNIVLGSSWLKCDVHKLSPVGIWFGIKSGFVNGTAATFRPS